MEPLPSAPPVVAVVVTCDPGPWFEETLASFAAQDYPNLSVLVVDAASEIDPTSRVAAVLPDAFVRRLDGRVGFGRAANEVLGVVEGASHFVFCHDDVAPGDDAIRLMVEEAFRSNAGVVTPKLVEWDRPDRLVAVGMGADHLGVIYPLVDRGELDQEQHDRVREVFVAPSSMTLVRADLFATLGGYEAQIEQFGEDLDLSWRAQVVGARVVTAPAARVRHLEAQQQGLRAGWSSPLARQRGAIATEAHRLRTLVACTGSVRLGWTLLVAVVASVVEAAGDLVTGRPSDAAGTLGALGQAFRHPLGLARSHRRLASQRHASDRQIRRRQSRGSARLRAFIRSRINEGPSAALPLDAGILADGPRRGRGDRADRAVEQEARAIGLAALAGPLAGSGSTGSEALGAATLPPGSRESEPGASAAGDRAGAGSAGEPDPGAIPARPARPGVVRAGSWRGPITVAVLLLILAIVGARNLLGQEIPAIGQIPVTAGGVGGWWQGWWSTWQGGLLGAQGASPPGLGLLGLAGTVFFGAAGALQRVLVLAPLVVGPFGAYRAARWWGSLRGRVAALIVYALVPVPYNALAHGDWPALLAYAAAPWLLSMVVRLSDQLPLPRTTWAGVAGRVAGLGVLIALVASFVPSWLMVVPAVGAALAVGSILVGQVRTGLRCLGVTVAGAVVAAVLLLPWSAAVLHSRVATFGVPVGASGRLGLGQVLRMHTGPIGAQPLGWALLAAAALPLVIGRSWRLAWAGRLWMVALVSWGLTWAGTRGWMPTPPPEDLLAFAAAALAASVALGAVAFELDLPGYRFGWRQLASGVAAIAVVVAGVPTFIGAGSGRWSLPSADAASVLGFLPGSSSGNYRILWVGSPSALPLASQYLSEGVAYATSYDGQPDQADHWAPPRSAGSAGLAVDIRRSTLGLTTELGHLLAPYAIRYIVLPNHNGPAGSGAEAAPVGGALLGGLAQQIDLEPVSSDVDYTVYLNAAWAPARAVVAARLRPVIEAPEAAQALLLGQADLAGGARPVLTGGRQDQASGRVRGGSTVVVSASRSTSWHLRVGGKTLASSPAYGWAMRFQVPPGPTTTATLSAGRDLGARIGQLIEIALWVLTLGVLFVDRRRRAGRDPELVQPEWFVPLVVNRRRRSRAGSRSGLAAGDSDLDSDELWIDA